MNTNMLILLLDWMQWRRRCYSPNRATKEKYRFHARNKCIIVLKGILCHSIPFLFSFVYLSRFFSHLAVLWLKLSCSHDICMIEHSFQASRRVYESSQEAESKVYVVEKERVLEETRYYIAANKDVWGMFTSHIDWASQDELIRDWGCFRHRHLITRHCRFFSPWMAMHTCKTRNKKNTIWLISCLEDAQLSISSPEATQKEEKEKQNER